jgi:5'-nucleotidase/UDP-sugar diphosphatase
MNLLGYDAAVVGEGDLAQLGAEIVRQRMAEAAFPFLSANAYVEDTGERLAKPYEITQVGGISIALVGLTGAAEIDGIDIIDPVSAAHEVVASLADAAEVLILISHAGLDINEQIAREVRGIDVIVSGGGQRLTMTAEMNTGQATVVQADAATPGHAGRRLGIGTFGFDGEGQLQGQQWASLPLTPDIADDPAIVQWVAQNP